MDEKLSIVLFSGTVDKLMAAGIVASGAAAMLREVTIFLTFRGLMAFKKDAWKTMDLYDLNQSDLEPIVCEVTGVAPFVEARGGGQTRFI